MWKPALHSEENGLEVLEEICPLSARMVVNQVSMKMENPEDHRSVICHQAFSKPVTVLHCSPCEQQQTAAADCRPDHGRLKFLQPFDIMITPGTRNGEKSVVSGF